MVFNKNYISDYIFFFRIGFADHNPMPEPFDDWRMAADQLPSYLDFVAEAGASGFPVRLGLVVTVADRSSSAGLAPRRRAVRSRHLLEPIESRGIRLRDLSLLRWRHAVQDALENLPRARERRFRVRIVGAPREQIYSDEGAVADAHPVFLETQEHVAAEEVARHRIVAIPVPMGATSTLGVRVVEPIEEVRDPRDLVLRRAHAEPRIPLEHALEDEVAQRHAHPVVRVGEERRP